MWDSDVNVLDILAEFYQFVLQGTDYLASNSESHRSFVVKALWAY